MSAMLLSCLSLFPVPSFACELALVLAVDVSGSVDPKEYRIQMDGLAAGLRDGTVVEALSQQRAKVTLIQWSGSTRQAQSIGWTEMNSPSDVLTFADAVQRDPRMWSQFSTAIGEALVLSHQVLQDVPECARKVVDVSGDGQSNEGVPPEALKAVFEAEKITVNAIAIETDSTDLAGYFYDHLIVGAGSFVARAEGFEDYPEKIRRKLQRETTKQLSGLRPRQGD
jgi:Ca-activated chloride channel family protein